MEFDFRELAPIIFMAILIGPLSWVLVTWLKVKNGYPIENMWGVPMHPKTSDEATERLRLITGENAQLRAELSSVKDRLATVERIVTDSPHRLDREIESLRGPAN